MPSALQVGAAVDAARVRPEVAAAAVRADLHALGRYPEGALSAGVLDFMTLPPNDEQQPEHADDGRNNQGECGCLLHDGPSCRGHEPDAP